VRACGLWFRCEEGDVARFEDVGVEWLYHERFITARDKPRAGVARVSQAKIPGYVRGIQFLDEFFAKQS
jgi:hypothetical protein